MRIEDARYFHRDGTPAETYDEIIDEVSTGELAEDTINGITVETTFFGINCGTWDNLKTFSTIINGGMFLGEYYYGTEEEALLGHKKWVEKVSAPVPPEVQDLADFITKIGSDNPYIIAQHILDKR